MALPVPVRRDGFQPTGSGGALPFDQTGRVPVHQARSDKPAYVLRGRAARRVAKGVR